METINVAEAKSRFSELISRAATGERFIIQRRERPVAALIGAAELERLERAARRLALVLGQFVMISSSWYRYHELDANLHSAKTSIEIHAYYPRCG